MTNARSFTEGELHMLRRFREKGASHALPEDGAAVRFQKQQGDFIVCVVIGAAGVWAGASHRSRLDKECQVRGQRLALRRALLSPPLGWLVFGEAGKVKQVIRVEARP